MLPRNTRECTSSWMHKMETYQEVLEQFEPMIFSCIRKLNIYKNHEHYIQSGRIALWQSWRKFDEAKGDFAAFAYRSIYGAMLDEMKRQNASSVVEDLVDEFPTIGYSTEETEHIIPLHILSLEDRQLLYAIYVEGYKMKELTARFEKNEAALKKRKERALRKLREFMGK